MIVLQIFLFNNLNGLEFRYISTYNRRTRKQISVTILILVTDVKNIVFCFIFKLWTIKTTLVCKISLAFNNSLYNKKKCFLLFQNAVAYASYCKLGKFNRPIAGYANFCPKYLKAESYKPEKLYLVSFYDSHYLIWKDLIR